MLLVVDTHALIWWTLEPKRLGNGAARALRDAERIGVPTIVFWETALLVRKGKLVLEMTVKEWSDRALAIPRVDALPLTTPVALRADTLAMHPDPVDRFIVATALEHEAQLVTKDRQVRDTGLVKTLW